MASVFVALKVIGSHGDPRSSEHSSVIPFAAQGEPDPLTIPLNAILITDLVPSSLHIESWAGAGLTRLMLLDVHLTSGPLIGLDASSILTLLTQLKDILWGYSAYEVPFMKELLLKQHELL
jgi:hypothetical protein